MIKFILTFFSILPLRLNHFIGALIGRCLYFIDSDSKRISNKNIQICFPELSEIEQQDLVKKSLIETGKGLSETGFIWLRSFEDNAKYVLNTLGVEHLDSKQPIILLVPHFGCWELAARMVSLHKPTVFLYKKLKNEKQNQLLLKSREQGDLFMAAADKRGVIKIHRAITQGNLIGILPDQDPGEEGSILAPFFGQDARTMTLLAKLARKNNAKVLMTWTTRLDKGKGYVLNLEPVNILSESGDVKSDVVLMNQAIEDMVRIKPEQYLWSYKRFNSVIDY